METPLNEFVKKTKEFTRNPLGIIGLFVWLIYAVAGLVLSASINNLHGSGERLPLIWFVILFPLVILGVFAYLVMYHHKKLYAPSDYKDEKNFVNAYLGNKDVPLDLEKVNVEVKSLKTEKNFDNLIASIDKISNEIERIKKKSEEIAINNLWRINHWGSNYASTNGDKMIFIGTLASKEEDGSHIDLNNRLEIGKTYEISCFAKSDNGTSGKFRLWCHDKTGVKPDGADASTPFKTPSVEGEKIKLNFKADYNKNIRIHLQYIPGQGRIEVSDIRISELD